MRSRLTKGSALSGTLLPSTPSIHVNEKPVSEAIRLNASRLSVRSGKPMTKTFSNYSQVRIGLEPSWRESYPQCSIEDIRFPILGI